MRRLSLLPNGGPRPEWNGHRLPPGWRSLRIAIAATLGLTNLLPTPSYAQYFVTLIPFLAVATIELIQLLDVGAHVRETRFLAIAALVVIVPAAWSFHVVTTADAAVKTLGSAPFGKFGS